MSTYSRSICSFAANKSNTRFEIFNCRIYSLLFRGCLLSDGAAKMAAIEEQGSQDGCGTRGRL